MGDKKLNSFEKLDAWQQAIELAVSVYSITDNFPKSELFGITSQLRRASSSVSANIAEGFGRKSIKEKINFYNIAYGSSLETKSFLYLAKRLQFISDEQFVWITDKITTAQKLLNSLIRSTKARK